MSVVCPSFHLLQKTPQNLNIHLHVVGDNFTIYKVFMRFQTQRQVRFTLNLFWTTKKMNFYMTFTHIYTTLILHSTRCYFSDNCCSILVLIVELVCKNNCCTLKKWSWLEVLLRS